MVTIALCSGVVGIEVIDTALFEAGFSRYSTLEVAGKDAALENRRLLGRIYRIAKS
jgi:hypothetical protein